MANANKIPELCNAMRVYQEGNNDLLGIADVVLPNIQSMTQTVSGMGMSGEVEAPVQGQYQSMKLGLNWNTQKPESIAMSGGKGVALECRGALQNWDSGNNQYVTDTLRIVVRGRASEANLGNLRNASTTDSSNNIEVTYLKVEYNGRVIREIDKYGMKDVSNGVDAMADIREALGI